MAAGSAKARDALAAGAMLEAFHRQCNVMSLANLAQIVNVLQATVMTEGDSMWLTPTYHVLNLHTPHIGAQALTVGIDQSDSLPDGKSAITATASKEARSSAVTVINRHCTNDAVVRFKAHGAEATAQLLTAEAANAVNSAERPEHVRPVVLEVSRDGTDSWCIELPAHSMATIVVR